MAGFNFSLAIGIALLLTAMGFAMAGNIPMASAAGFVGIVLYLSDMISKKEKQAQKRKKA